MGKHCYFPAEATLHILVLTQSTKIFLGRTPEVDLYMLLLTNAVATMLRRFCTDGDHGFDGLPRRGPLNDLAKDFCSAGNVAPPCHTRLSSLIHTTKAIAYVGSKIFNALYLHPLRHIPGPWTNAVSRLPYVRHVLAGTTHENV